VSGFSPRFIVSVCSPGHGASALRGGTEINLLLISQPLQRDAQSLLRLVESLPFGWRRGEGYRLNKVALLDTWP
jgi:hypothetical protein